MRQGVDSLRMSFAIGRSDRASVPRSTGVSMRGRTLRYFVVVAALLLTASAWAQNQAPTVKVGFSFFVADKSFPAGNYSVDVNGSGKVVLTPEKGAPVELAQLKTLNRKNVQKPELVFERVGASMRYLSEVWVPGKGGFQIAVVDNSEERESVK